MGVPRLAAAVEALLLLALSASAPARAQSQPIGAYDPSPCATLTPAAAANDPSCNTDPVTPAPPPPDASRRGLEPALQDANSGGGFAYGGRHNQYLNRVGYNSSAIPVINDGVYQQLGDSCDAGASTTDFSSYCGRGLSCEGGECVQAYAKANDDCNELTSPALPCASGLRCVQSGGLNAGAGTCQRGSNIPVPNVDPSVVPDAPVVANNTHYCNPVHNIICKDGAHCVYLANAPTGTGHCHSPDCTAPGCPLHGGEGASCNEAINPPVACDDGYTCTTRPWVHFGGGTCRPTA